MRITGLGHAGLFIETEFGNILCDPWLHPAYFGSWYPHPDNRNLDWNRYGRAEFLFVSHRHQDHLDAQFLSEVVDRSTTVLLPDYPTDDLYRDLRNIGFRHFRRLPAGEKVRIQGLDLMITPMRSPSDGPIGDASLSVGDGRDAILNQNDAHLLDLDAIRDFGHYSAHFMQHSGAIWWPMAYEMPLRAKQAFAELKRASQRKRALFYAREISAGAIFPFAGPPAFLDPDLVHLNGVGHDGESIFEAQDVFLRGLRAAAPDLNGYRFLPGTVIDLDEGNISIRQTLIDDATADRIEQDPWVYLRDQQKERSAEVEAARPQLLEEVDGESLFRRLKAFLEPIMKRAPFISRALSENVQIDLGCVDVILDFTRGEVRRRSTEKTHYWFRIAPSLVLANLANGEPDWCNSIFLSLRFKAGRIGKFNEYLYAFFTSLSEERIDYIESWYATRTDSTEMIHLGEWDVQRNCPHLGADLGVSGAVEGNQLICRVHGWRFNLETGVCITTTGEWIKTKHSDPASVD